LDVSGRTVLSTADVDLDGSNGTVPHTRCSAPLTVPRLLAPHAHAHAHPLLRACLFPTVGGSMLPAWRPFRASTDGVWRRCRRALLTIGGGTTFLPDACSPRAVFRARYGWRGGGWWYGRAARYGGVADDANGRLATVDVNPGRVSKHRRELGSQHGALGTVERIVVWAVA